MINTSLHTLSRSWHESAWLYEQLAFASAGDSILLMQDAVLALQSPISLASFIAKCKSLGVSVNALQEDCTIRGVQSQYPGVVLIGYEQFVELVETNHKQLAW